MRFSDVIKKFLLYYSFGTVFAVMFSCSVFIMLTARRIKRKLFNLFNIFVLCNIHGETVTIMLMRV